MDPLAKALASTSPMATTRRAWARTRQCLPQAGKTGCTVSRTAIPTIASAIALMCWISSSPRPRRGETRTGWDRKSTRLNSSHLGISYAGFCLKKNKHRAQPYAAWQRGADDRVGPDAVATVRSADRHADVCEKCDRAHSLSHEDRAA